MGRLRTSLLALTVFLPCASLVIAQAPTPTDNGQAPVYRTHARDVVIDVVVTKGHNEPVTGLHAQDFVVLEDGKPQTIDYFEEHTNKTLPPGALPELPKMPSGIYTNVPPAPPNDSVNVLLLDTLNTEPQDQANVRRQIVKFLLNMKPGTRMAIFALGSKLRFVQGFTTDSSVLLAALADVRKGFTPGREPAYRSSSDVADDKEAVATLQAMLGSGHSDAGIESLTQAMADYGEVKGADRTAMTLEALQYLARYLGGVPGRKNLIWFAGTFPITIYPSAAQQQQLSNARGYLSQVKSTADLLTASQVAVYPVGAEGIMNEHVADSTNWSPGGDSTPGERIQMGDTSAYSHEASSRADNIYAMEQLATDTGGKAFYNTNDLDGALDHAITNGSRYYTLVYSPANKKMDGRYRQVEVKAPGEKLQLSYRRGYNADDTQANAAKTESNPLQPLMARGLPSTTQILYGLRIAATTTQPVPGKPPLGGNSKLTGPTRRYSVDFMIRWTDLKFDAAANEHHAGKVEVQLLAYDRDGHALNWLGGTQAMDLDPKLFTSIQKSGVPAHLEIDVPADKNVYLETGVYDYNTGKAGTLEIPLPEQGAVTTANVTPPAH